MTLPVYSPARPAAIPEATWKKLNLLTRRALLAFHGPPPEVVPCPICGKEFEKLHPVTATCGGQKCRSLYASRRYRKSGRRRAHHKKVKWKVRTG